MSRQSRSKLLDVLGRSGAPTTFSDENLKTLHAYLFLALVQADFELKRRGLGDGQEVYLRIANPQ
jgi:hypothetical protein